jgi:low affinity Fe/Cu permease
METIYFLSGVGAVLLFLSVVFVSGIAKRVKELEIINQDLIERDLAVHRRIDQEIDRTDKMNNELERTMGTEIKDIYSTIDSRLDKLEQKLSKQVIKG